MRKERKKHTKKKFIGCYSTVLITRGKPEKNEKGKQKGVREARLESNSE